MPAPPSRKIRSCLAAACLLVAFAVHAQGVDLTTLQVHRGDSGLRLDFGARLSLPATVRDALQRGIPMYFVADATLFRQRWYWRDEAVAEVSRVWRISYQPLTATWRVALGALSQTVPTLPDALATVSNASGWLVADADRLERSERYYVEFRFRLDNSRLPGPMQIDIGDDWKFGIERKLRVE